MEKGIILSTKELALQKVLAMFLSLLLIIGIALVFHFPQVSLSLAMSAFLSSSVFWELSSQQEKIRVFIKRLNKEKISGIKANIRSINDIYFYKDLWDIKE